MKKHSLFLLLFPLATMFKSSNVFAADPPQSEYEAALAAITDGSYYLTTDVNGTTFYVTQNGYLTDNKVNAYLFAISKVNASGAIQNLFDTAFLIDPRNGAHFSNATPLLDGKAYLHLGFFYQDDRNNRDDWERQVFYLKDGKFAIRTSNTLYGETSWFDAGRIFWSWEPDETDGSIIPCYSYEPAYVWTLETQEEELISFADANVKNICVENWDTNEDGELSSSEAAAVTDIGEVFTSNKAITSFGELRYFTGLDNISDFAFYACDALTVVNIPNSVTSIGDEAFAGCSGLTSVTIPNSVTFITDSAFDSCSGLTSITNSRISIEGIAFEGRCGLTSFTIPNSVTSIGEDAFYDCSSLTSITIPNSVTSIGDYAFSDCYYLNSVTIPGSVTSIGNSAFERCYGLTSVTIPGSVTSIGEMAFQFCRGLTSVTISNGVTSIERSAFYGCTGLTSITIPNSVFSIGGYAFGECSSLTSITIPNSVTDIGYCAFDGTAWYNNQPDGLVYAGKVAYTYKGTMPSGARITIEDGTLGIACSAFRRCTSLTSVTIPISVTSIGDYAFQECSGLTSVTIGSGVTNIGTGAFSGCTGLTSVTIPESVTSIGNYTFYGCSSLISITIPESVISIGSSAFYDCIGLTSVTIPEGVTSIGIGAFENCLGLTSITIPNSVTSIGQSVFSCCNRLTSVIVDRATPITIASTTFSNQSNATLYVPYGSKSAYEAADYWNEFKEIVETTRVTIGSTGYATYCSECDLDFSEVSGLKAYIASGFSPSTGKLVLTRVTEVPAGEGLYIVGDEGRYNIPATTTDMFYSNLLKGVTTATTIYPTDGDNTNFILANGSHGVAFYSLSEAGELAAGKAYLQLPTASVSEVKAISVIFDDDEDAIQNIEEESQTQRIYNLQGQQVNAPKSGLYIINGKKVFIK